MKRAVLLCIVTFIFIPRTVFAASDYVLPYPQMMPGSKLYTADVFIEKLQLYWYFGNFSQFTYNLKMSDKYLVEAKTLFEYRQYALGIRALEKSNIYFKKTPYYLKQAQYEGKNISEKSAILNKAAEKHKEILDGMRNVVPAVFDWQEEKGTGQQLLLHRALSEASRVRSVW